MSLRALLALLFCAFAFFGGAGAFEGGQALHDGTSDECKLDCCNEAEGRSGNDAAQNKTAHGCCDTTPNQDGCCTTPMRGGQGSPAQHSPATAQAAQLKAHRAPMRAAAGSLFYALFLTATTPDAAPQALARATADPVLATPTPALRVTQCRWQV